MHMYTHAIMLMSLQQQSVGKGLYVDPVCVYLLLLVYICMRTYLFQVLCIDSGHLRSILEHQLGDISLMFCEKLTNAKYLG